jgi:hypothetical protein
MKRIYEPQDIEQLPESEIEPHIDIVDGIRIHFHKDGVSFGIVSAVNDRFSAVLSFDQVREMMIKKAKPSAAA